MTRTRYRILRATDKEHWKSTGSIYAETKAEAIEKMIHELPHSFEGWEYVALCDADDNWMSDWYSKAGVAELKKQRKMLHILEA